MLFRSDGATPAELRAGVVWNIRAALNVAALQCDFEPTLQTRTNYNAMLAHHKAELASAFTTLGAYFKRTHGASWQKDFDQYGTRIYSGYSTVQAQRNFCQVTGQIGRDAIFADRGKLYDVAENRIGELKRALSPAGEQLFGMPGYGFRASLPPLNASCWKKNKLTSECQAQWDAAIAADPRAVKIQQSPAS